VLSTQRPFSVSSARVEAPARQLHVTAQQHVAREKAWWREHRDYPEVFAEELEQALKIVAMLPGAGTVYSTSPVPGVHRIYLRRVALHLYYTFNDEAGSCPSAVGRAPRARSAT
jgi:hypothetical protein